MEELKFIIIPFFVLFISQVIKCFIESINNQKIDLNRFLDGSGGMPSSHSAIVTSITTIIGFEYGISSTMFAMSLIFSLIILYDAKGVRYETGKQAVIINEMIKKNNLNKIELLKEKIGHKPIEVFWGMILGVSLSSLLYYII